MKKCLSGYAIGLWLCTMVISHASSFDIDGLFKAYQVSYEVKNPLVLISGATTYDYMKNLRASESDMDRLYTLFADFYGYDVQTTYALERQDKRYYLTMGDFKQFILNKQRYLVAHASRYDGLIFVWCGYGREREMYFSDTLPGSNNPCMSFSKLKHYFGIQSLPCFERSPKFFVHVLYEPEPYTSSLQLIHQAKRKACRPTTCAFQNMLSIYSKIADTPMLNKKNKKNHGGNYLAKSLDLVLRKYERDSESLSKKLLRVNFLLMKLSDPCHVLVSEIEGMLGAIHLVSIQGQKARLSRQVVLLHRDLVSGGKIEEIQSKLYALRKKQVTFLASRSNINVFAVMDCFHAIIFPYLSKELHDEKDKRYKEWVKLYGVHPWCGACYQGNIDILAILMEKRKQNKMISTCFNTCLLIHHAAMHGHIELLRTLVDRYKMDIHVRNKDNNHALHIAAIWGQCNVIRWLVDTCKVDIHMKGKFSWHVLHMAAAWGHCELFDWLVTTYKIDVHLRDEKGQHAVHLAAGRGQCSMIKFLVDTYKVDINVRDNNNNHALHVAAYTGTCTAIRWLVSTCGVYIDVLNKEKETPLHFAAKANKRVAYEFLLELGADENKRGGNLGKTAGEVKTW